MKRISFFKFSMLMFMLLFFQVSPAFAQYGVGTGYQTLENSMSPNHAYGYLIADKVSLRKGPTTKSDLIGHLPIGSQVSILRMSDSVSTIKGITSNWYQIRTEEKEEGYLWGGLIAYRTFGSNVDPDVKFLIGFSHVDTTKDVDSDIQVLKTMGQIRAVKDHVELDKVYYYVSHYPVDLHYITCGHEGSKGLKGVDDVIMIDIPCIGGCGCSGGTNYIFWTGKKLKLAYTAWGTADAEYSEGDEVYFPSDMLGEKGFVRMITTYVDGFEFDFSKYDITDGMELFVKKEVSSYYVWQNDTLVKANRPDETEFIFCDSNRGTVIPEPPLLPEDE